MLCRKRKIIATYHADLLDKGLFSAIYFVLLRFFSAKKNVTFVVPTPSHYSGTLLHRLQINPLILPFIFIDNASSAKAISEISKSYESEITRFLFVGRHVHYKGIDIAIVFMSIPSYYSVEFNIVGDGPLSPELRQLAISDPRIHFTGSLSDPDLASLYSLSNVFVLPSISKAEAFGLVQVEAMLHHCLCLSSFLDNGVNFVNKDGVSGFSFQVNDSEGLAKLMMRFCSNIPERNRLMSSSREYSLSSFASNDLRESYLHLYSS